MTMTTLADYLRYLRVEHDYTQQDIANLLGIHRTTYTYYENGKTEPNLDTLKKLAVIYGINVTELIMNRKSRSEIMADSKLTIDHPHLTKAILTDTEHDLINNFKKLTPEEKNELLKKIKEHLKKKE